MCQNVFRYSEEKQRKETFTRLFVMLASNKAKEPVAKKEIKK